MKKENTNNEKIANKEIQEVLKKYKFRMDTKVNFPMYRQLPIEVQLALKIIHQHGASITVILVPIE